MTQNAERNEANKAQREKEQVAANKAKAAKEAAAARKKMRGERSKGDALPLERSKGGAGSAPKAGR